MSFRHPLQLRAIEPTAINGLGQMYEEFQQFGAGVDSAPDVLMCSMGAAVVLAVLRGDAEGGGVFDVANGGAGRAADGRCADVVAAGEFVERSALRAATGGLFSLCRCFSAGGRPMCCPRTLARLLPSAVQVRISE
jgi:hypothetical protein